MKKKKSRARVRQPKPRAPGPQYEQTFNVKLVALECDGHTLYGLDDQGRAYAYTRIGWTRIDNDDVKLVPKTADLDALGKEHASKLPDDQRHAVALERERERNARAWETMERIMPMLDSINKNVSGLYDRVFAIEDKVKKNGAAEVAPTGAG